MMDTDVIIIGGGIVGLAIADSLASQFDSVFLIERNNSFGLETSSRNSEVVHSGIYYPPQSLKAMLSKRGNDLLYKYCDEKKVKYNKCGKYVIGFDNSEKIRLEKLKENALANGVKSKLFDKFELKERQPNIIANYALYFKNTGVVDSHGLMSSIINDIKDKNVNVVYKTKVKNILNLDNGYSIKIENPDKSIDDISCKILINSAGLESYNVSSMLGIKVEKYKLQFWKGDYFAINNKKKGLVDSLIYPLPEKNNQGLGIHTTIDLSGRLKLGPDSTYIGEIFDGNYMVNEKNQELFFKEAKKYLPFLDYNDLQPDQSGVRPKLQKPGETFRDFIICNESKKGCNNFINLIGIESPGLTASLAIGEYVKSLIL